MYRTKKFIDLEDSQMKKFRKLIRQFKHNYSYSVDYECDRDQVDHFLTKWLKQQKVKTATFWDSYHYCHYCLDHKRSYGIKTVYVEVAGKLVGMAMGVKFKVDNFYVITGEKKGSRE